MRAVIASSSAAPSSVASLDSPALARRLGELAGDERRVQADFLLHLDAFDRRRGYLDAGYSSLWEFCQKALHLREGAAGRRIAAMRVLRRFPVLEGELREGKLCLSTLGLLGPVLTEENLHEVVARAAFRTRAEVDRLAASMQPRPAPKDGIRRVAGAAPRTMPEAALFDGHNRLEVASDQMPAVAPIQPACIPPAPLSGADPLPAAVSAEESSSPAPAPLPAVPPRSEERALLPNRARPELRPLSEASYSLRITLDAAFKGELDRLRQILSHKVPSGALGAVLREAVRCAIEKHGKRRGAVAPSRERAQANRAITAAQVGEPAAKPSAVIEAAPADAPAGAAAMVTDEVGPAKRERQNDRRPAAQSRPAIPVALRREVWARDGGRCAWRGSDGRRCESRWQLEFDHVVPVALGGPTTAANLRITCRAHNSFHAERVFGREHMARFRRGASRQGELAAIASGGGR